MDSGVFPLAVIRQFRLVSPRGRVILNSVGDRDGRKCAPRFPFKECIMRRFLCGLAMALSLVTLGGASAYGQDVEGVIVKGSRMVTEDVGRSRSVVPISEISLSYKVTYADLDLGSNEGKVALEKRVSDAALAACKEISRLHPGAKPDDVACAKAAVDDAMVKVKEAVAAARK